MYRVRKTQGASEAAGGTKSRVDGRARRTTKPPRLADFRAAASRLDKRGQRVARTLESDLESNRQVKAPRGARQRLEMLRKGSGFGLLVPLSEHQGIPSLGETIRVIAARKLQEVLEHRGIGPTIIVLWPGIPQEMSGPSGLVVDREGVAHELDKRASEPEQVMRALVPTEFSPWLLKLLSEAWDADPRVLKCRLLFELVASRMAVTVGMGPQPRMTVARAGARRSTYRTRLARLIEQYALLGVVSGQDGEHVAIEQSCCSGLGGGPVFFTAPTATIIEGKVERWLEKLELTPEEMLNSRVPAEELGLRHFPLHPQEVVAKAREAVLGRVFAMEQHLAELGIGGGERALDRLANRVDGQFDRLKAACAETERRERSIAQQQAGKSRAYLRPAERAQMESMSVVYYLNFYGPDFVQDMAGSLDIGDARHHLVYVGN